jgi:hypothetical protein
LRNGMCTFEEECLIDIFRIDGWYKIDAVVGSRKRMTQSPALHKSWMAIFCRLLLFKPRINSICRYAHSNYMCVQTLIFNL